ncbi:hypothetical protein AB205_0100850 [Aquarana catesbeiana]|uniref:Uncharacterized protein n=1 Tax=Aquarana catesbeiana TaxID=8400 RepID=A0A2G9RIF9_AQUCT|nr:hypothetical protein AB205_0100850 [Aquarana catesbeiana]
MCMYPVCGTTTGCGFWKTRLKPRNHFLYFHPPFPQPFPQPQLRLPEDQPGSSILEEVEEPSWSQEDLSQNEALECGSQEAARPSSLTQSQVPPLCLTTKRARKMSNVEEAALGLIKDADVALKTPPDAEEAYGCYVAAKLLQMEEDQCFMCENIIFQALRKGLRGQISENMHLCALAHPPPPPPATSPPPDPQPPRKDAGKAAGKRGGKAAGKTRK